MAESQSHTIHLAGLSFEVESRSLSTEKLKLDTQNPRVRYLAEKKGLTPKTNKDVWDLLFEDDDIRRLRQDIKGDGGLHEQILVNADGSIIEGNSRAACFLTLHAADKSNPSWQSIPARVLTKQMQPNEVALLQGYYHVRGKNRWAAYAQAAHVYRLLNEHKSSIDAIRQATGMQAKTIEAMARAYQTMHKHSFDEKNKQSVDDIVRTYSYVFEFEKSTDEDVKKFRDSPKGREQFVRWVKEDKFERGEDVRNLGEYLRNKPAFATFKQQGSKHAKAIVRKTNPTVDMRQYRAVRKLIDRFKDDYAKEVEILRGNQACRTMLEELATIVERLLKAAAN